MRMKGLSPLVAVVMLIAFTLLVAGILGGLVTQFAQEQRAQVQFCTGARALILRGAETTDESTGLSQVTLSIQNFGDVDLTFNVLHTHKNETVTKVNKTMEIKANDIGQLTIKDVDLSASNEFTIQSLECPGAQDNVRASELRSV
ncbi:MAG: hypothetical protein ISS93_03250 [Candidatus Aenigmarchaeota archaeon]|nr:hypothetical protein [Candidatus Aenigmarchaeota archaeon]